MKKILSFLAVAVLAATTQASTVSWSSDAIYNPVDFTDGVAAASTASGDKVKGNQTMFIYLVSDSEYTQAMEILGQTKKGTEVKAALDKLLGGPDGSQKTASTTSKAIWKGDTTDYAQGAVQKGIGFILATGSKGEDAYSFSGMTMEMGELVGGFTPAAFKFGTYYTEAVPEPTTIALFAIGLAALGLRRKVQK